MLSVCFEDSQGLLVTWSGGLLTADEVGRYGADLPIAVAAARSATGLPQRGGGPGVVA